MSELQGKMREEQWDNHMQHHISRKKWYNLLVPLWESQELCLRQHGDKFGKEVMDILTHHLRNFHETGDLGFEFAIVVAFVAYNIIRRWEIKFRGRL